MANPGTIRVKEGSSWVDILHPVNSWYFSKVSTSPASLFGGTWQQITDAVLRSATDYGYGGSDSMTLTVNQMPSHTHVFKSYAWARPYGETGWNTSMGFPPSYGDNGVSINSSQAHSVASTGGGQSFSKLPRYCNLYCWVRTA